MAEAVFAELLSICHGNYVWEGGLGNALCGNPAAVGKPMTEETKTQLTLQFAPTFVHSAEKNLKYLEEVKQLLDEKRTKKALKEKEESSDKVQETDKEVKELYDQRRKLREEVYMEYKDILRTGLDIDEWRKARTESERRLEVAKRENEVMKRLLAEEKQAIEELGE